MGSWDEQGVSLVDGLDVHERHYGLVPVDPTGRHRSGADFAEDAGFHRFCTLRKAL